MSNLTQTVTTIHGQAAFVDRVGLGEAFPTERTQCEEASIVLKGLGLDDQLHERISSPLATAALSLLALARWQHVRQSHHPNATPNNVTKAHG